MKWYSNLWIESTKIYLRWIYTIGVWYEVIIQADLGHYEEGYEQDEDEWKENYWKRKLGIIIMYTLISFWNTFEQCNNGW